MELKIKKLCDEAKVPFYATEGSAGMDLSACIREAVTVKPLERVTLPTGIAVKLPEGTVGLVFARSGLAVKHGITLSNSVGVIDSDYTGEIKVGVVNLSDKPYAIQPGDRIAQLAVMPYFRCETEVSDNLEKTLRGSGGFGSSGR
ncbi:MAG: dUTP diphosphatase [Bacillota bacterium]|nr:dUTP diphosphatase [Bacillota bacterium]